MTPLDGAGRVSCALLAALLLVVTACGSSGTLKPVPRPHPPFDGWAKADLSQLRPDLVPPDEDDEPLGLGISGRIRVMTYNVRYASDEEPNSWAVRRPVLVELLRRVDPDILGTQEALYEQVQDIDVGLPTHGWIGLGRDGGSRGEFMAIFYRRERFEPVAFDHYWLSDTPDVVGSTSWGNTNRRMVSWVRLRDRDSGDTFVVLDTHFDHEVGEARRNSANLIVQRLADFDPEEPLLLLGDFNAAAEGTPPYWILVDQGPFDDTWVTAHRKGPNLGTYGGWERPLNGGARIDWILSRGPWRVLSTDILTFSRNGQFPSDHFPVMADLVLEL